MPDDWIEVRGLKVEARIGVPDAERAEPQRLLVDLRLRPLRGFSQMPDSIEATVDYFAVAQRVAALSAERPRRLIETLADEIAAAVLREFPARRVEVTVRKFILPDTEFVAVHCARQRND
ncbi:MAG: dihydroneopterin aldolase [Terrimicrobiaceae bacterium]|nr:dihydroneopterin aldolase [Terrimicrobiaceae bacterium]